jgi:hypothetical protein
MHYAVSDQTLEKLGVIRKILTTRAKEKISDGLFTGLLA